MSRGRFITIEGSEGVGKTTQIAVVEAVLEAHGIDVVRTREPGGTPVAERIRDVLLRHDAADPLPWECELLLMFAARSAHLANLIRPALTRGAWVVCDRFTDATYAYQGGGRGLPREWIQMLETLVQQELRPDLTLLLDAPLEIALDRARTRNASAPADRFERETSAFFDRVRATYLERAHAEPDRIRIIDASPAVETVSARIRELLETYLRETGP
jgi:dTMP kinase